MQEHQLRCGIRIHTHFRAGYQKYITERGEDLSEDRSCNNKCIQERDDRSWDCFWKGWPQDVWACAGNNSGKELDKCMSYCWSPAEMTNQRPILGTPYNSSGGDKCFNEFTWRSIDPAWTLDANRDEWTRCMATVP